MSQTAKILDHLKAGHPITGLVALEKFGCFRLAARIRELRKAGYRIESSPVKLDHCVIAEYRMQP